MIDQLFQKTGLHIESPMFALLLPILVAATILAWLYKQPSVLIPSIRPYLSATSSRQRRFSLTKIPLLITLLGMSCLVLALMRPQRGVEETIRRTEGIDIMLAIDFSGSMEAYDIPKDVTTERELNSLLQSGNLRQRIQVAKDEVKRFIDKRPNDRIGLIAFAANPYTACPPTLDHEFLKANLDRLQAGSLGDGTGIAAPIAIATTRLKESKAKRRVLVLFTDGENNIEAKVAPSQAADIAAMFDVIIHTVGIGSDRAFVIRPNFFGGQQMVNMPVTFNTKLMEEIALKTQGRYFLAEDAEGLKWVMNEIDALEKTSIEQPTYIDYRELYRPFLYAGIALILAAYLSEHTFCLTLP